MLASSNTSVGMWGMMARGSGSSWRMKLCEHAGAI